MNTTVLIGAIILLIVVLWFFNNKPKSHKGKKDDMVIYGSMGCPHTVKQVNKYPGAEFIDCSSGNCPDWVTGYPTTKMPDGTTVVGYKD